MKGPSRNSAPAPHPLSLAVRKSMGGVSLVELLLVAGVVVAGAAVVFSVASNTQAQSKRSQAQSDLREFHSRVLSSYQNKGNFDSLTTASALADNLFPRELLDPVSGQPVTPWGGAITVSGTSRNGGIAGSSLVVAMEGVPGADCAPTATALATGFSDIVVNQISVGAGRNLDVGQLAEACSGRGSNLIQLFWDNPNPTPDLGSCSTTTETRVLTCPPGQLGSITQSRLFSCPSMYAPAEPGPWSETSNTCAPACVVPSPAVQTEDRPGGSCPVGQIGTITESRTLTYSCPAPTGSPSVSYSPWAESSNTCAPVCVAPAPAVSSRTLSCPTGQLGQIVEEQTRTWTCPAPTGSPTSTLSGWVQVSNTCAPICVAPAPSESTFSGTASCVSPRITPDGRSTFSRTRVGTVTYSCPAPTGNYVASPISYSPWTPTESQACAEPCVLPTPNPQIDTENRTNTQTLGCPSGQLGNIYQERAETRTRSRTASCPTPTGNVSWTNWSGWSGWNGGAWVTTRNTCAPACVVPTPATQTQAGTPETRTVTESQTVNQTQAGTPDSRTQNLCPAGQYGVHNQTRTTTQSRTATQTRTQGQTRTTTQSRTASCPAPTGAVSWTPWSAPGAPYGTWTNSGSPSAWSSPQAPYSNWSAPGAPYGNWTTVSNTCKTCPTAAVVHTEKRWYGTYTQACPAGQLGLITREREQSRDLTRSYTCPAGTGSLPAPTETWSGWSNTGVTRLVSNTCAAACVVPNPSTQTQAGPVETRSVGDSQQVPQYQSLYCPAGQYGRIDQQRTATQTRTLNQQRTTTQTRTASCPAPTGAYTWSPWSPAGAPYGAWQTTSATPWSGSGAPYTNWSTYAGSCTNCPAPTLITEVQWVNQSAACPNPYWAGSHTWQGQQTRTYYQNWDCPANTVSLPPIRVDRISAWAWTGARRNEVKCSLPACGSTLQSQAMRYMAANQDLYNAFAGNWQAAKNHWDTYGHKEGRSGSCWAPPPACAPKTTTVGENTYCSGGQSTVSPGYRTRTAYWTCPGPTITSYSGWTVHIYPQCCPAGRTCQIQ